MNHQNIKHVAITRATDLEKVALLLPIRPDHFINKHFIAEKIKINEFYNNLNKKFNTDEEIIQENIFNVYIHSCVHEIVEYPKSQRQRSRRTP